MVCLAVMMCFSVRWCQLPRESSGIYVSSGATRRGLSCHDRSCCGRSGIGSRSFVSGACFFHVHGLRVVNLIRCLELGDALLFPFMLLRVGGEAVSTLFLELFYVYSLDFFVYFAAVFCFWSQGLRSYGMKKNRRLCTIGHLGKRLLGRKLLGFHADVLEV